MATQTFIPLATTTVTADSQITFQNIPNTYAHLFMSIQGAASTQSNMWLRLNNDATSNYKVFRYYAIGSRGSDSNTSTGMELGNTYTNQGNITIDLFDYADIYNHKFAIIRNTFRTTIFMQADRWQDTSAVSRLDVVPVTGTFTGTISLYGLHG